MNNSFGQPQSVLVLGGASDIARATVMKLVNQRCRKVLLAGRRPEVLNGVANEITRSITAQDRPNDSEHDYNYVSSANNVEISTAYFDALDRTNHQKHISEFFGKLGNVDLVIVAFGILGDENYDDPAGSTSVIDVNFSGAVSAILCVLKQFKSQGYGELVVLSSVAGVRVRKSNFIYGSSKSGLDGFCLGLADELHGSTIRIHTIRPGFIHTKMTNGMKVAPLARKPEDVADAILQCLGTDKSVVWVPQEMKYMMAILQLLPRSIFRRLPI